LTSIIKYFKAGIKVTLGKVPFIALLERSLYQPKIQRLKIRHLKN
jgi:hypothetical protein